jgi:endogenous inhibitor of DNA gyrase (YacG/DUF329 family)
MEENFIFNCPECGNAVEAPIEAAGVEADCPECGKPITIPMPTPTTEEAPEVAAAPPPPPPPPVSPSEDDKSKTMRLELPDLDDLRMPVRRNITIKRNK